MSTYYFEGWYEDVKAVLPEEIRKEAESRFDEMARKKIDSKSFIVLFNRFVDEKIGKSANNPISVKVYSKMTGFSEDRVRDIFYHRGLE